MPLPSARLAGCGCAVPATHCLHLGHTRPSIICTSPEKRGTENNKNNQLDAHKADLTPACLPKGTPRLQHDTPEMCASAPETRDFYGSHTPDSHTPTPPPGAQTLDNTDGGGVCRVAATQNVLTGE